MLPLMVPAVDVLRAIRALPGGTPYKRSLSPVQVLVLGVGAGVLLGVILIPLRAQVAALTGDDPSLMAMVIGLPLLGLWVGARKLLRRRRERPTVAFEFPVVVPLPGWFVWTADDALYLTRRSSLVCLFCRPADEPLVTALAAIDPDRQLVPADAEVNEPGRMNVTLAGDPDTGGSLRRLAGPAPAYVLVISPEAAVCDDVDKQLALARFRTPDEPAQKWRPLSRPVIASARAVRRA